MKVLGVQGDGDSRASAEAFAASLATALAAALAPAELESNADSRASSPKRELSCIGRRRPGRHCQVAETVEARMGKEKVSFMVPCDASGPFVETMMLLYMRPG